MGCSFAMRPNPPCSWVRPRECASSPEAAGPPEPWNSGTRKSGHRMQKLFTNFLKGILILAPMLVTVWVIYTVFTKIDGLLGIPIPGLGFAITIVFIILVGALASN